MQIVNAKIVGTMLGLEDHGIFTYMIDLDYGGSSGQGFGGYSLGGEYTNKVILGIMKTVGVETWEKLRGNYVRVEIGDDGRIRRIGNLLEDIWFNPSEI